MTIFWNKHTSDIREDFPVPNLYQSAIYSNNENEINSINNIKKNKLIEREKNGNLFPMRTKIKIIKDYVKADISHQQYNLKNK